MIDLPANDYMVIYHNPHKADEISVVEYINEHDILPDFLREEIGGIIALDELWMVCYMVDEKYYSAGSYSIEKCLQRLKDLCAQQIEK